MVERLGDSFVEEKKHVSDAVRDIHRILNSTNIEIRVLEDMKQKHDDQIKKADAIVGKMQKDQLNLKEATSIMGQDVSDLVVWQKTANNKIEKHTMEHQKTRAELWQMGKGFDTMHTNILDLKNDLGATNVTMEKLGSRFDTCNQDLSGMTKGFQDTHGHVLRGEKGMLPPSVKNFPGLPAINPGNMTAR